MARTVTLTELQKMTREVIDWTRTKGEPVVVETNGKALAAILSYDEYKAYLRCKEARSARFARLRRAAAENAAVSGLAEAEALALVDEARQALHEERRDPE